MSHVARSMSCEEVERAVPWLLDDELDAEYELQIESHIGECDACRAMLQREGKLRAALHRAAESMMAPARLRQRLNAAMEAERRRVQSSVLRYWPAAAAAAILCVLAWKGAAGGFADDLDEAAVRHARDLPMDVVAADALQVQRYLSGKLPFAVRLPTLPTPADRLGGRVTHLNDREAAYIRYDTPHGRVSVFVYQDPGYGLSEGTPLYEVGGHRVVLRRVRGYPVALWRSHGLVYSVVADLPDRDFQKMLLRSTIRIQR